MPACYVPINSIQQVLKYPLAVNLGTITPGKVDVYSYEEDSIVMDPKLSEHLSHFGINMVIMFKVSSVHNNS